MKMRPVRAELLHADGRTDGRTDLTELIVALRNFANVPKNGVALSDSEVRVKQSRMRRSVADM
jgi:hypothetical protein